MTNKETFASTYSQAFIDSYPQIPAEQSKALIEKAVTTALASIRSVNIDALAFKLTCKRLGIECNYKSIEEYLA